MSFLSFGNIKGEVTTEGHERWIEIISTSKPQPKGK